MPQSPRSLLLAIGKQGQCKIVLWPVCLIEITFLRFESYFRSFISYFLTTFTFTCYLTDCQEPAVYLLESNAINYIRNYNWTRGTKPKKI